MSILPFAYNFPNEAALIGRLVIGYGELELSLFACLVRSGINFDKALKETFRERTAAGRITNAQQVAHANHVQLRLGAEFNDAVDGMRYCSSGEAASLSVI